MITITFPNNKQKTFPKKITGLEIAKSISKNFSKTCIAIEINNKLANLTDKIENDSKINFITLENPKSLEIIRHTAAHILAQAVVTLYPKAKLAIGPVIKDGFYYDIDMDPLSQDDLPIIENEMKKIIKKKLPLKKRKITKNNALKFYKDEPFKIEMILELPEESITLYQQDDFIDLCKGPHAPNTGFVKYIKLLRVSAAHWRAKQSNPQLQRIYGTAFFDKKELKEYMNFLEEAKKRNHKKISKKMDLVSFIQEAPGMPVFQPNGMIIWNELINFWRIEHEKNDYLEIKTPMILSRKLWEKSGHWENYKENIYTTNIDNNEYAIKPMNCPGSILTYKKRPHSYKELPLRIAEIGLVHRHELSGVLNGLFRVRAFHQDDAHIFMTSNQIENEIFELLKLEKKIYEIFGLDFKLELSTKPKKFIGTNEQWDFTTNILKNTLEKYNKKFSINQGDGAFYGPKIDFHVKDALNRKWQCGTIQLDMSLPERFNLCYIGKDNKKHRTILLHRTILGSIERFFGILIEHFAGKFPLWLSPIQVIIIPLNDALVEPAKKVFLKMKIKKIRVKIETKTGSLNKKIREAQTTNIPLILIYGKNENETNTVSVRSLNGKITKNIDTEKFINIVTNQISKKLISIDLF